jgi:hypothetical protein
LRVPTTGPARAGSDAAQFVGREHPQRLAAEPEGLLLAAVVHVVLLDIGGFDREAFSS